MLVLPYAHAAEPVACYAPSEPVAPDNALQALDLANPETIVFEVGEVDAQLGLEPRASMTGGVLLRQGDKLAGADVANYEPLNQALLLQGNVRYEDPSTFIQSDSAEFTYGLADPLAPGDRSGDGGKRRVSRDRHLRVEPPGAFC